jgi:hypothetical protein
MGYETGAVKYFVNTLLTTRGYVSFYIFGDGIWNTLQHFQTLVQILSSDNLREIIRILISIYTPKGVDGWLLSALIFPVVGGLTASFLWYIFVPKQR